LAHRILRPAAVLAVLVALGAGSAPLGAPAQAATTAAATAAPSVTPSATPVPAATAAATPAPAPAPTPEPGPRRRGRNDEPIDFPSAGPTSPAFATLDGIWEVQVQYIDRTDYSHFTLKQNGQTIAGTWNVEKASYPIEGTYDGRLFRFSIKQPTATLQLSGYVETASDMVGIIVPEKGANTAFTASHRSPIKPIFGRRRPG
jgi:hypothetical protein